MTHDMNLYEEPFQMIRNGTKTVELRLNDEKRRKIHSGDQIFFHNSSDEYDVITCKVINLVKEDDFYRLYEHFSPVEMGYEEGEKADPADMYEYYPKEKIDEYGVLGIVIEKMDEPYLVDSHMHLEYGPLSTDYVMAFVSEAVKKGLDEIDILDHTHRFKEFEACYEHLRRYEQQDAWLHQKTKFCNTLDDYRKLIAEVKQMDLPIRVKFGLEVCYTENTEDLLKDILKDTDFDFLTGAIHSVDGILYDMSFSDGLLWDQKDTGEIYRRYYEIALSLIRSGLFDRFAHPDQLKLAGRDPRYDLSDTYHKIAEALKQMDMYGENNSGIAYRYGHQDIGISDEMLKIFKEYKVKMITASDAHKPEDVGTLIREATFRARGGQE